MGLVEGQGHGVEESLFPGGVLFAAEHGGEVGAVADGDEFPLLSVDRFEHVVRQGRGRGRKEGVKKSEEMHRDVGCVAGGKL